MGRLLRLACAVPFLVAMAASQAVPLEPGGDAEVIERLLSPRAPPKPPGPLDAAAAVQQARTWLNEARAEGDPRLAGRGLALLKPWANDAAAPPEVVLSLATIEQYLHDFEGASKRLEGLLARDPRQAQAWLTLATLRRVQGRYAASDAACGQLKPLVPLHGTACQAENDALRGRFDTARQSLTALLAERPEAGTRTWLATTLAELEERAGQPQAAERAYRAALAATPGDAYATLAFADLLLAERRPKDALALLAGQVRSDAVLLRLAQAGREAGAPSAPADAAELRERFAQAAERPGGSDGHARERAMFVLDMQGDAAKALSLARENVRSQREPLDVLLLARVAKAAGDAGALAEASALKQEMGLDDRRLDALL